MKNIREIYQALLNGKSLKHRVLGSVINIKTSHNQTFPTPKNWEIHNKEEPVIYCRLKKEYDTGIHVSPIYRIGSMQYNKYISLDYEPFDYTTYKELK